MKESFQAISEALKTAGFTTLVEESQGKPLDYKITPYSLNSSLSFRFENLQEFTEFIETIGTTLTEEKMTLINNAFIELGVDPNQFFYVNFFEKGKELDM